MDPVTHAASGAVAMLALPHRPATRWAVPLAALAAAAPDVDVLLAHTPLQFLLLHRGLTHSLFFAPVLGLALTLLARPLWKTATPGHWRPAPVWLFMTCMVLLHIWLDCITTYGTMIFVPFSHLRVRLNAVFIIDLLLTLPLLLALWRWRDRWWRMLLALVWLFVYPLAGLSLNSWHTAQVEDLLAAQGKTVRQVTVLPDAFAPFFWRALYEEESPQGMLVHLRGLDALGRFRTAESVSPAASPRLLDALARQSVAARAFFDFAILPVVRPVPPAELPTSPEAVGIAPVRLMIYDLRFGSSLGWVREIMNHRPNADIPFKYLAEVDCVRRAALSADAEMCAAPHLLRERLRFSDSRQDSLWRAPRRPEPAPWPLWLVGLY